jgi:glycyl-tRNA synthetase beta chain
LFFESVVRGATLAVGLQKALAEALAKLPIPKLMTYQLADGWTSVQFVRPAHGLAALHGSEVVDVTALGLAAGRVTQGHRFESRLDRIEIRDADSYVEQLANDGSVIASFDERRAEIARQLDAAVQGEGLIATQDDALLDEVTALVERPNVLVCHFDDAFLGVPQECLILTMKANQKYFPLLDASGKLSNRFLVVSNIRPADASAVILGNERVVRPRLADARFFFDQDRKRSLESRLPGLDKVVYHNLLGSQGERVARVRTIAGAIAQAAFPIPPDGQVSLTADLADRAARLAKADLLTDMVGEFPELQGVMGGYYARHDGEAVAVAEAIEDHYKPRFAGDSLPRNEVGVAVALADKLETLVGLFGAGQVPTGDKDPFALRRHALGVIRMLTERANGLALDAAIDLALTMPDWPTGWAAAPAATDSAGTVRLRQQLLAFFADRLTVTLRDQGYSAAEVDAVVSGDQFHSLALVPQRLAAVRAFAALPEAASLAAANKRVANILKKAEAAAPRTLIAELLVEPAERQLNVALTEVSSRADRLFDDGDYTASLRELASLKAPVDAFFDQVMVNADDPALRANRLALLASLSRAMNRVADLSRLAA